MLPIAPTDTLLTIICENWIASHAKKGIISVTQADDKSEEKPLEWVGSSRADLKRFPKPVRVVFGQALFDAQTGRRHPAAKPLKGFGGAGVLEVVEEDNGNAYRAVYTVRFSGIVYVLHAFQKKSKAGIKTPAAEMKKVRSRLKDAEKHYAQWKEKRRQADQQGSQAD